MTRLYGRALRGERVVEYVPDGRWESMTMLSALRYDGTTTAMVYEGGTDVPAMLAFVEDILFPTLYPGDIVAMDNLSSHRDVSVIAAIEAAGAEVWFLPRYSPDYNPIEHMWSKVKAFLRKVKARTGEMLIQVIANALQAVTATDAANWFADCGIRNTQS